MLPSAPPDTPAVAHASRLREAVVHAAHTSAGLREFLGALRGADAAVALTILEDLAEAESTARIDRLLRSAHAGSVHLPSELPIVHPLDYAWLFTADSQTALVAEAAANTGPGELIVYLGCPTVHERGRRELRDRLHLLLDRDARRVHAANRAAPGSALELDLLYDPLPDLQAAHVIADPPWYPASAHAFLNAATLLLRAGANVRFAFADLLTRPDADRDLSVILEAAEQSGLEVIQTDPGSSRYQTPPFERAALDAAGYPGVPDDWRLGSLTTLRRTTAPAPPRIHVDEPLWLAHEIDNIPLRTRPDAPATGEGLLQPLLGGESLPSVSRRDPRRLNAALWSSRNRIYASSDPPALARLLSALAGIASGAAAVPVSDEIVRLVTLERQEHGLPALESTA